MFKLDTTPRLALGLGMLPRDVIGPLRQGWLQHVAVI